MSVDANSSNCSLANSSLPLHCLTPAQQILEKTENFSLCSEHEQHDAGRPIDVESTSSVTRASCSHRILKTCLMRLNAIRRADTGHPQDPLTVAGWGYPMIMCRIAVSLGITQDIPLWNSRPAIWNMPSGDPCAYISRVVAATKHSASFVSWKLPSSSWCLTIDL